MSLPRFFVEHFPLGHVYLPESEAGHARQARRLSVDDPVTLFNGAGSEGTGTIVHCSSARVEVAVVKVIRRPRPSPALTLAVALPKGNRQDTLIAKCTELGIAGLQPLSTERSLSQANEHKIDKWRRVTIEAAKQSQQAWLPALSGIKELELFLKDLTSPKKVGARIPVAQPPKWESVPDLELQLMSIWQNPFDRILLAAPTPPGLVTSNRPLVDLLDQLKSCQNVLALIGPEGGWTDDEYRRILEMGAVPVSLGPNILRIETAAIAVAAFFHGLAAGR